MRHICLLCLALLVLTSLPKGQVDENKEVQQRFLSRPSPALIEYEATRHMEGGTEDKKRFATMDVEIRLSRGIIFDYRILEESGSKYIRNNIMRKVLEEEKVQFLQNATDKAAFSTDNYTFLPSVVVDKLWKLPINPRKKRDFLIAGFLLVNRDGELYRSEGKLVKNPHFMVRDVFVTAEYQEIDNVRLPITVNSRARVLVFGKSFLSSHYLYQSVNGMRTDLDR